MSACASRVRRALTQVGAPLVVVSEINPRGNFGSARRCALRWHSTRIKLWCTFSSYIGRGRFERESPTFGGEGRGYARGAHRSADSRCSIRTRRTNCTVDLSVEDQSMSINRWGSNAVVKQMSLHVLHWDLNVKRKTRKKILRLCKCKFLRNSYETSGRERERERRNLCIPFQMIARSCTN